MPLTIRSTRITDQPPSTPDFQVMSGGLSVGRIYEDVTSVPENSRWYWALNGVHAGPSVMQIQGRAPTLDAAKTDLRANWEKWLAWPKLSELTS